MVIGHALRASGEREGEGDYSDCVFHARIEPSSRASVNCGGLMPTAADVPSYTVERALMACYKCLWFNATDDSDPDPTNWTGECRCRAPSDKPDPVSVGWNIADSVFGGTYLTGDNTKWQWPSIQGDGWCGDHSQLRSIHDRGR